MILSRTYAERYSCDCFVDFQSLPILGISPVNLKAFATAIGRDLALRGLYTAVFELRNSRSNDKNPSLLVQKALELLFPFCLYQSAVFRIYDCFSTCAQPLILVFLYFVSSGIFYLRDQKIPTNQELIVGEHNLIFKSRSLPLLLQWTIVINVHLLNIHPT